MLVIFIQDVCVPSHHFHVGRLFDQTMFWMNAYTGYVVVQRVEFVVEPQSN